MLSVLGESESIFITIRNIRPLFDIKESKIMPFKFFFFEFLYSSSCVAFALFCGATVTYVIHYCAFRIYLLDPLITPSSSLSSDFLHVLFIFLVILEVVFFTELRETQIKFQFHELSLILIRTHAILENAGKYI